jgi:hypothetical protein
MECIDNIDFYNDENIRHIVDIITMFLRENLGLILEITKIKDESVEYGFTKNYKLIDIIPERRTPENEAILSGYVRKFNKEEYEDKLRQFNEALGDEKYKKLLIHKLTSRRTLLHHVQSTPSFIADITIMWVNGIRSKKGLGKFLIFLFLLQNYLDNKLFILSLDNDSARKDTYELYGLRIKGDSGPEEYGTSQSFEKEINNILKKLCEDYPELGVIICRETFRQGKTRQSKTSRGGKRKRTTKKRKRITKKRKSNYKIKYNK